MRSPWATPNDPRIGEAAAESILGDPRNHAPEGDERIRTAARALGTSYTYELPATEHVYAIGAFDDDGELLAFKVGVSRDVAMRLNSLQVGTWYRLQVLAEFDALAGAEKRIHARLTPFRLRGEWFRGVDEAMEILDAFCDACVQVLEHECEAVARRVPA